MKKAFKINLSGQIFHIDEDAYEKLKNYLDTLGSHFSDTLESREIISDIESRIAELFSERMKYGDQIISIKDVYEIIDIMGKPEEIASEEDDGEKRRSERKQSRRLFRDPDNNVFGGVCAGLSLYFNIDTLIIRILFIVLVLVGWGLPIILYLIFWIAVPKAKTAAEKLEMRGEKVNVSNIEKTIKEEYDSIKGNLKKVRKSETLQRAENFFNKLLKVAGIIFIAFIKIILVIIASAFIITGIALIIWLIATFFHGRAVIGLNFLNDTDFNTLFPFICSSNIQVIVICFLILLFIPLLAIIYGLFKMIFKFRTKNRLLGLSAIILWLIALITAISIIAFEFINLSTAHSVSQLSGQDKLPSHSISVKMDNIQDYPGHQSNIFKYPHTEYYIYN